MVRSLCVLLLRDCYIRTRSEQQVIHAKVYDTLLDGYVVAWAEAGYKIITQCDDQASMDVWPEPVLFKIRIHARKRRRHRLLLWPSRGSHLQYSATGVPRAHGIPLCANGLGYVVKFGSWVRRC